ncbi:MAG: GNAT family N-acetyltransferase [Rhodobacteraceae bacterium]|nr:MAG: GNAT family N-acetyltransferase [Paracoccaceae bacterium]
MTDIKVTLINTLKDIDPLTWDQCACPETKNGARPLDPFTTFRFLFALEESKSVGENTGWVPNYLIASRKSSVLGVMPLYLKGHSQGEYIFDHNWAQAYSQAGGHYYPKFQIAVPFTPVSGRRLLVKPGHESSVSEALIGAAKQIAIDNQVSSIHFTFCADCEVELAEKWQMLGRKSLQYHWLNNSYRDFEDFLSNLSSRKRKAIKKERRVALQFGGEISQFSGTDITPNLWDSFWKFYQDTGARKWGVPYLKRSFFDIVQEKMRDDVLLVMAHRDGKYIAGALNFIGRDTLFGRYWGCNEDHSCLHYELCYYQAIDYALSQQLKKVEAGAQGEHKLARGYMPAITNSMHWFLDKKFHSAVERYLNEERSIIHDQYNHILIDGPFKKE